MFGSEAEKFALPVVLTLTSGDRLTGDILLSRAQKLAEALNRPDAFIEFRARDGRTMALAKHAIASAATMELPRTDQMARGTSGKTFDPHQLLGIEQGAAATDVRAAYIAKARLYHPDQFVNHPLPKEVSEYLQAMFVHVQAAYEELSAVADKPKQKARRRELERTGSQPPQTG